MPSFCSDIHSADCPLALSGSVSKVESADEGQPIEAAVGAGKHLFERHCTGAMEWKEGGGPILPSNSTAHAPDDAALKSVISIAFRPRCLRGWFLQTMIVNLAACASLGKLLPSQSSAMRVGAQLFVRAAAPVSHPGGPAAAIRPHRVCQRARHIKKSITRPSENLPDDFLVVEATTAAGKTIEGIRVNEDSFTIQIKDATGTFHSLGKRDLKDLKKLRGQTPMPPFEGVFTDSELDDLVAYMASRGKS